MSDRFNIPRNKVQLIGAAVLLIAGKLEESYKAPSAGSLLYYCDGLYTRAQLLSVEALILKILEWRVAAPTPHVFAKLLLTQEALATQPAHACSRTWQQRGADDASSATAAAVGDGALLQKELRKEAFDTVLLARAMQVLDAATLDIECLKYRSSTMTQQNAAPLKRRLRCRHARALRAGGGARRDRWWRCRGAPDRARAARGAAKHRAQFRCVGCVCRAAKRRRHSGRAKHTGADRRARHAGAQQRSARHRRAALLSGLYVGGGAQSFR